MTFTSFEQYLDYHEAFLDKFINQDSEHELFISSYIHGHFSVEAAKTLNQGFDSQSECIKFFREQLCASIEQAINNNELEERDAEDVKEMLDTMKL